ncbi:MAG TPA: type II toxin-antitoxin system Phd/YefM family antitoxin [Gemmatimonadaceae bacterium]|nr:type II toxin-antitoxin system Phd/YefM family antitoxin [Gemmatimonadaceae bacterium]
MSYVNVHTAKTTLSKLIARAIEGEEIIIARGSEPVAMLVAFEKPHAKRKFGALRGKVTVPGSFFEPLSSDELSGWDE